MRPGQYTDGFLVVTLQDLQATLEGGNLDPGEVEKAKAVQKEDFPEGIEESGTDALRLALISYTTQVSAGSLCCSYQLRMSTMQAQRAASDLKVPC